uniref:Uncharacterized protein n=1 Tax=Anopheles melas TaxID=34690 RepID=A0A182U9Q0_9DIPT
MPRLKTQNTGVTVELWRVLRDPSLSSSDEGVVELLSATVLLKSIVAYPSDAFFGLSGGSKPTLLLAPFVALVAIVLPLVDPPGTVLVGERMPVPFVPDPAAPLMLCDEFD